MNLPKSIWEPMMCQSEDDRANAKTWFSGLADDLEGPIKANVLTRTSDDRTLKIRALFNGADGKEREMVRVMKKNGEYTISISPPTAQRWV